MIFLGTGDGLGFVFSVPCLSNLATFLFLCFSIFAIEGIIES